MSTPPAGIVKLVKLLALWPFNVVVKGSAIFFEQIRALLDCSYPYWP